MASRKNIFSWYRIAKLAGIPYHFFTQNKVTDEQKEKIIPVLEKGASDLLQGNYRLIETFSADSPDSPDSQVI